MNCRIFHRPVFLLFAFFLLLSNCSKAQETFVINSNAGFNAGLSFTVGSPVNRVGVKIGGYYYRNFIQLNAAASWFLIGSKIGPPGKGTERQLSVGVVFGMNSDSVVINQYMHPVSNQMNKKYSLGYALNFYSDSHKTSQRTGTIGIQIDRLDLFHENDILGRRSSDRYRTAALYGGWRMSRYRIGLATILWTGNADSPKTAKVEESSFSRYGYKDLSKSEYGMFSHGILNIQIEGYLNYGQVLRLDLGLDAEQIRNTIQNKWIHDMVFWPDGWNKAKNKHVPMLDQNGMPFLYNENQRIRKPRMVYQFGLNQPWFY